MSREPRRYLTHDCDQGRVELVVQSGDNGDWYVSIVPEGWKFARLADGYSKDPTRPLYASVRVTTSGERRQHHGVAAAVVALYRAMGGEDAERLEKSTAEPLSAEEIAFLDRSDEEWSRTAAGFDPWIVRRLLATIRARDEQIRTVHADYEQHHAALAVELERAREEATAWKELAVARGEHASYSTEQMRDAEEMGSPWVARLVAARQRLRAIGIDPDATEET